MSAEMDHAILMSYDAMRICMGQSPVNATVSEVIRWMQVISGEPDRIAELENERDELKAECLHRTELHSLYESGYDKAAARNAELEAEVADARAVQQQLAAERAIALEALAGERRRIELSKSTASEVWATHEKQFAEQQEKLYTATARIAELEKEKNSRCEHCGSDRIFHGPPCCPGCGAPVCCQVCCKIENLERDNRALAARIAELEKERERIMEVTIDKQSLGNLTFTYNPDDGRFYAFRGSNLAWSGQATYTVWRAVLMSEELTKLHPRIAELEAEVARLREDGKRLFYSYDPENGIEFHESAEEAKQRAEKALDDAEFHAADSDWHWVGNEHEISWGSVREQVEMHEREMTPKDKTTHPECTYMCAPKLEPIDAAMSAEGK